MKRPIVRPLVRPIVRPLVCGALLGTLLGGALLGAACPRSSSSSSSSKGDGGVIDPSTIDPAKYAAYLTRYPFGGQTTEWWSERLTTLKSGDKADPALYALTVERAKANGLIVEDGGAGAVVVKPGRELAAVIITRMGVK